MPIISSPEEFNEDGLYVDLRSIFGHSLLLKCEGFNFAGSVKLKAATEMVEAAERDGTAPAGVNPGGVLVGKPRRGAEHDRGEPGYRFLCVTDSRCNLATRRLMEALGAGCTSSPSPIRSAVCSVRASTTSSELCAADDRYVWLNQYTNANDWKAHYRTHGAVDRPAVPATWTCCSSEPARPGR